MIRTVLAGKMEAAGARLGEFLDAVTALDFGDPAAEFGVLRRQVAIFDQGWRVNLEVRGADRVRWLNGMVTNNVRDLPSGRGTYNFLLDAQGHILGDLYVYNLGDYLLAETDRDQAEPIRKLFDTFIIMDEVEVADPAQPAAALGLAGPQAAAALEAVGIPTAGLQALQLQQLEWKGTPLTVIRKDDVFGPRYDLWMEPDACATLWDELLAAGARPVGCMALEMDRVARGIPRFAQDIRGRELPQETGQQRALNFEKGCYVGQEIVERVRSRGQVHRTFAVLVMEGWQPVPGIKLRTDDREVGEITSVAVLPNGNGARWMALGYLRREAASEAATLETDAGPARVVKTPFQEYE